MALKTCPNCGKLISDKAKVCPKCGMENPFEAQTPRFAPEEKATSQVEPTEVAEHAEPVDKPESSEFYCPECGYPLNGNESICPECGYPIERTQPQAEELESSEFYCPECGHPLNGNESSCPECGCPIEWTQPQAEEQKRSDSGLKWLIALFVIVLLGGVGYYYYSARESELEIQSLKNAYALLEQKEQARQEEERRREEERVRQEEERVRQEEERVRQEEAQERRRQGTIVTISTADGYNAPGFWRHSRRRYVPRGKVWIFKDSKIHGSCFEYFVGINNHGLYIKSSIHNLPTSEYFVYKGGCWVQIALHAAPEDNAIAEVTFIEKDEEYYDF